MDLGSEPGGREDRHGFHTVGREAERRVEADRGRIRLGDLKLDGADVSALFAEQDGSLKQGASGAFISRRAQNVHGDNQRLVPCLWLRRELQGNCSDKAAIFKVPEGNCQSFRMG